MSTVAVTSSLNVNINFELAGVVRRFFAWLIDFVIRIVLLMIIGKLFKGSGSETINTIAWVMVLLLLMFYFLLWEMLTNGQSPGKKIFSIKVVSLDGYKPTTVQYLNRWVFRLMDTGFITIIFFGILGDWIYGTIFIVANIASVIYVVSSKKEQRIGDLIAHTVVIRLKSMVSIRDTIFTEVEEANYKVTYADATKLSDRDISIIKAALQNAMRTNRYERLYTIAERLYPTIAGAEHEDPYHFLSTLVRDYNYLTTR